MRGLSRFERRILLAIAVVATVSLGSALGFGYFALRDAYRVGVNPRVGARLERSLELYRQHLLALRREASHTATSIARDAHIVGAVRDRDHEALHQALGRTLSERDRVARAEVRSGEGELLARAERDERLDPGRYRLLVLTQEVGDTGATLEVTLVAPRGLFEEHRRTGEEVEVYRRLEESTEYLSSGYLIAYISALLSVFIIALVIGLVLGRRITRRVGVLAEATRRVGRGELNVSVPTDERDELGELIGDFNLMVRDLRESRDRIDYLSRISAWQEFARRLAHEIKNPLTPIQLAVQQVHRKYKGEDQAYAATLDETLEIVEEEVRTLRRLVGEFSDFARLPVADLEPADLGDFAREAMRGVDIASLLGPGAGLDEELDAELDEELPLEAQIEIDLEIGEEAMPVRIDTMMLRRVLDNLVRNAAESIAHDLHGASPRGTKARHITVAARREGQSALLIVQDEGPGIPEERRAEVFNPYFTTKSEGTGLGLAIVKKVILEHHGAIACEEAPGGGASFEIRIPLAPPPKRGKKEDSAEPDERREGAEDER
jgi:nitrogen fixation/metabolism regulation signal transduction histidine kinase